MRPSQKVSIPLSKTFPVAASLQPGLEAARTDDVEKHRPTRRLPFSGGALRLFALAVVAAILLPLVYLLIRAAGAGEEALSYLTSPRTLRVVVNSLGLTAAVAASAVVIGVPFAWLTTRTDLPLRRMWLVAGLLPLVIPSYIGAMAYIAALGPRGLLQQALAPLGVESLPPIYGFFGAWFSITMFTYPYIVLPVRAALLNADPALEETARSLGLRRRAVFFRVTLAQLRPAIATGALLTALYTLSDFGAVALMKFDAFTRVIYVQYTSSFNRGLAAVLSLVLVAITLSLIVVERRVTAKNANNYRAGSGVMRALRPIPLRRWKLPALAFCATLVGVGLVIPVGVLVIWLTQGLQHGIAMPDLLIPAQNGILASGLTALFAALVALPLAILAVRAAGRAERWLVQATYLGNGLPGLVISLALVFFAANLLPGLYQTLPILVFGYAVRFLPLSIGSTRSALTQISPRLEEAARSLGLRAWQAHLRITVPLVRAGILGGIALVFLNAMKELPTTLLLAPTGFATLATQVWSANNDARFTAAAAPALALIVVSALALIPILRENQAG